MSSNFRTLLVIGDNHPQIAEKYSLSHEVEPYIRFNFSDREKLHVDQLKTIEKLISQCQNIGGDLLDAYKDMYDVYMDMSDEEFYDYFTESYSHDKDNNALSTENPNAKYMYEKCYDDRIRKDQRNEGNFSLPFVLKDGTKAYSAKKGEIDWSMVHMHNVGIYESTWEVCVEGKEPENETEEMIKNSMSNRTEYFSNFKNKDEYVKHNCAFWCYGVATEDKYESGDNVDAIKWTSEFYGKYIVPLSDDTLLSIYEIKLI